MGEHGRHWLAKNGLITRTMLDWGSGCYRYECTMEGLFIIVGDQRYHCLHPKTIVEVTGWMNSWHINGSLICPPCQEFCGSKSKCLSYSAFRGDKEEDRNANLEIASKSSKLFSS